MAIQDSLLSLQGLSTGDAFGEQFVHHQDLIERRELPPPPWRWTDDTHMALSIVENLREHGQINQDALIAAFARRFMEDPHRGYGSGAKQLLQQAAEGQDWREISPALFNGGSHGNGGAMRAAPIGGYFAGLPQLAAREAHLAAEVTHAHPEGQAGAMAVAAAAALAADIDRPHGLDFIKQTLAHVPFGLTHTGIYLSMEIPPEEHQRAAGQLGSGKNISAQDTVPYCIWCAAYHLDDFEEALWTTALGMGDVDTTCAIVGGIVALSARKIPSEWLKRREPLPETFDFDVLK